MTGNCPACGVQRDGIDSYCTECWYVRGRAIPLERVVGR
jgi:hypothetical protein